MQVPCLTLRENTERPVTVTEGTNILIGRDFDLLDRSIWDILNGNAKTGHVPEKWDGNSGKRLAVILEDLSYSGQF